MNDQLHIACADLLTRLEAHARALGVHAAWSALRNDGGEDVIVAALDRANDLCVDSTLETMGEIATADWLANRKRLALNLSTAFTLHAMELDDPWLYARALEYERDAAASARATASARKPRQRDPLRAAFVAALRAQRNRKLTLKAALARLCADTYKGLHITALRNGQVYRVRDEKTRGRPVQWALSNIKSMWQEAALSQAG